MTGAEFENGVNNILDNTPQRGVAGSAGITKTVLKQIVAFFKTLLNDVNAIYDAGLFWRGAWSAATAYSVRDVVSLNGSTYRCKAAHTNQAVTNTSFWELVAAKGESGDQVLNFGNSIIKNGAFENNTLNNWESGLEFNGFIKNGIPYVRSNNSVNVFFHNTIFEIVPDKLIRIRVQAKSSGLNSYISVVGLDVNKNGLPKQNTSAASLSSVISQSSSYYTHESYAGGRGNLNLNFNENARYARVFVVRNGNTIEFGELIVSYVDLSDPVPSNLGWIPDGQAVVDPANSKRRGVYISAIEGIEWITGREIVLPPNGTNVVFNLRRPYKFTWNIVNNDGVTIVSQPSATVNANTDALITLTGTAGKTLTLNIQESV